LRSIFLPLGIKVLIALLPSKTPVSNKTARPQQLPRRKPQCGGANPKNPAQSALTRAKSAHGPNFHPLPNKSVRVRTTGAGPQKDSSQAEGASYKARIQQPAACSSRSPRSSTWDTSQPGPNVHTGTPGATPRKDFRIPESGLGVNENPGQAVSGLNEVPPPGLKP
jgi:hypothetical protein